MGCEFETLLRDFLKLRGPDLRGKRPDVLHRYSFVSFLCDWAQNGCVNNSARDDGSAKLWWLLCYEICINCIKHSVWNSAVRPLLSVFIVRRQRDQDADGNGLLCGPWCRPSPHFSSDVLGVVGGLPARQHGAEDARVTSSHSPGAPHLCSAPWMLPTMSWIPASESSPTWGQLQGGRGWKWRAQWSLSSPALKCLPSSKRRQISLAFDDYIWRFEVCFIRGKQSCQDKRAKSVTDAFEKRFWRQRERGLTRARGVKP